MNARRMLSVTRARGRARRMPWLDNRGSAGGSSRCRLLGRCCIPLLASLVVVEAGRSVRKLDTVGRLDSGVMLFSRQGKLVQFLYRPVLRSSQGKL